MTLVPFCGRFLPCLRAVLRDPIRSLCVAGAIFFDASEHCLRDLDPRVACDPTSFLCGRCKSLATMVTLLSFCVAGAIFSMPRGPLVTCIIESMGCRGGENFDKRNVVESVGCRGGGKF